MPPGSDVLLYELMSKDNQEASDLYWAGKFWADINRSFSELIYAGALENVRNEYFNRRFAAPNPHDWTIYCALIWLYWKKVRELDTYEFLKNHEDPLQGGADDQVVIEGKRVSLDFLQSVEEAYSVQRAWRLAGRIGPPKVIVELGAGYGRLAYVCRKLFPDCTYVILDLPEGLICAASWLSRVLPGEPVPYSDARGVSTFSREKILGRRVWLLGTHQIEKLSDCCADAFVNVYSFAEMPRRSIDNYFSSANRIVDGVFFTKQRNQEFNSQDGVVICKDDYPIPTNWTVLFLEAATLYPNFFQAGYAIAH
jgi:hypothetical protein